MSMLYFFGHVCESFSMRVLFTCEQTISFYVHMCVSIDFPMIGEAFLSIMPKNQDWEWVLGTIGDALIGVAVVCISSLLMDGWNMNTSPAVLHW